MLWILIVLKSLRTQAKIFKYKSLCSPFSPKICWSWRVMWMLPSSRTRPQNIFHFQKSFGKLCSPCLLHTIMRPTTMCWRDLGPTIFQRALLGASLDYSWWPAKMSCVNCVSDLYVTYSFHLRRVFAIQDHCIVQQLSVVFFFT